MSALDLDAIEARAAKTTPGPWVAESRDLDGEHLVVFPDGEDATVLCERDARFIAAARTDVPALVAEVRRLRTLAEDVVSDACETERNAVALVAEVRRLRAMPEVSVRGLSGDGSGPWRLFIGAHGVATWPSKPALEDPHAYAQEVARCVAEALQAHVADLAETTAAAPGASMLAHSEPPDLLAGAAEER